MERQKDCLGDCPYCGAEGHNKYSPFVDDGESGYYPAECEICGRKFREYYNVEYACTIYEYNVLSADTEPAESAQGPEITGLEHLPACPRGQSPLAARHDRVEYVEDLVRCLPWAEHHLGKSAPQLAVFVHPCVAEVVEGKGAQLVHRFFHRGPPGLYGGEKSSELCCVHAS